MKRVMIIGGPGAGKSTMAKRLGEKIGLPVFHLDGLSYGPDHVKYPKDIIEEKLLEVIAQDRWIIDGNFNPGFPDRLARADTLVMVDAPTIVRFWRIMRRMARNYGKPLAEFSNNRKGRVVIGPVIDTVLYFRRIGRPKLFKAFDMAPDTVDCYFLKSTVQIQQFYAEVLTENTSE